MTNYFKQIWRNQIQNKILYIQNANIKYSYHKFLKSSISTFQFEYIVHDAKFKKKFWHYLYENFDDNKINFVRIYYL